MSALTIAFLGDIFAQPGMRVVQQQLPILRENHQPDLIIANAENACRGSGLSPTQYERLREWGIDGVTLGDHAYRQQRISTKLERPEEPIIRPVNLSPDAVGKTVMSLRLGGDQPCEVVVMTVLGRVFMNLPADNPFNAVDTALGKLAGRNAIVIVEAHMEATSEKAALAHHLDGRAAAVLGTHTHVPTADARLMPKGTAFITDVGMCGPTGSVIGRDPRGVLRHMRTGMYAPFEVGSGGEKMCGALLRLDRGSGRALSIERFEYAADLAAPPFAGGSGE